VNALSTRNLSCGYPETTILQGVNVELASARFVCVIGSNGVGKSTLLRTVSGLLPPVAGEVLIDGQPLGELKTLDRAQKISVVLTGLPSIGYLTVRQFVEVGRHPYTGTLGRMSEGDHAAVDSALDQVGLRELADRWLSTLSDGERQRVSIARALAQGATLMVLDEPTAFLDVESRAIVMTTLRALAHRTRRSVIAASHDIDLVLHIADEIWMIEPDRTIVAGAPEDLVLDGALDRVFPRHVMEFDLDSGNFRLPRPRGVEVLVTAGGHRARWVARALERIGLQVRSATSPGAGPAPPVQVSEPESGSAGWLVSDHGQRIEFSSIAALVEHFREP
jgi:iron complex transport system ATP-binding protein